MGENEEGELDQATQNLFAKGFNAGYLIEKDDPKLLKSLTADKQSLESPFMKGMLAGSKEQKREKYLAEE